MKSSLPSRWAAPRLLASIGSAAAVCALLAPLPVAAAATVASCPKSQALPGVYANLANPNPMDSLIPGGYVLSGNAIHTTGSPIVRISVFLDDRDSGGADLFDLSPGQPGAQVLNNVNGPGGFTATVQIPNQPGGHVVLVYAQSASGKEAVAAAPITIQGTDPNNQNQAIVSTPGSTLYPNSCGFAAANPGAVIAPPATTTLAAPVQPNTGAPVVAPIPATSLVPTASVLKTPTLLLANPNPGDSLAPGSYMLSGVAFDAASKLGSGVDQVTLFLDDPNAGGLVLGSATLGQMNPISTDPRFAQAGYSVAVTLSPSNTGAHSIVALAHSTVTDRIAMVSVPIMINRLDTNLPS